MRRFYAALNDAVDARLPSTYDRPVVHDQDLPVLKNFRNDLKDQHLPDCLLVCLEEKDAAVIDRMWRAMENIFSEHQQDRHPAKGLHRQTLSRDVGAAAEQTASGYDYIHFPPVNEREAEHLRNLLSGEERRIQDVRDAFDLICHIGRCFSAAHLTQAKTAGAESLRVIAHLLDSGDQGGNSRSFQRLAKYYYRNNQLHQQGTRQISSHQMESIRPHCDWSFATLVPVSAVTGLEIYNGNVWIRPEEVARRHYRQQQAPELSGDENNDTARSTTLQWQSRYIVVLAGKWLEILTNGAIRSTIHRVVRCCSDSESANSPAARRMSAPLFLRPTRKVSEDAEDLVWEAGVGADNTLETARKRLSDFLLTYGNSL